MTANLLPLALCDVYLLAALAFMCERNAPKALYFLGSAILTLGVYYME